jgi:hypothetical protein
MLVTLHTLAQSYHLLPSEALARATTFDLFVLDNYSRFMKYQEEKSNRQAPQVQKKLTQLEMQAMIDKVRKNPNPLKNQGAKS